MYDYSEDSSMSETQDIDDEEAERLRLEKERIEAAVEENKAKVQESLTSSTPGAEPVETIAAKVAEWKTLASARQVKAEMFRFKKEAKRQIADMKAQNIEEEKLPVEIEAVKLSADGKINIVFNQPLIPPVFVEKVG